MANTDKPHGLRPVQMLNGSPWNGKARKYYVDGNVATAVGVGSAVKLDGNGDGKGTPGVAPGAAVTDLIVGAVVAIGDDADEVCFNPTSLEQVYLPASTAGYVWVVDASDVIFEVQEASGGTALVDAAVGLNADLTYGGVNTTTGFDAVEIDNSTEATTAGLQVKLVGLSRGYNSDGTKNTFGEHAKWLVVVNQSAWGNQVAGV